MEREVRMNLLSSDRGERVVIARADNDAVLSLYEEVYTYKIHLHTKLSRRLTS